MILEVNLLYQLPLVTVILSRSSLLRCAAVNGIWWINTQWYRYVISHMKSYSEHIRDLTSIFIWIHLWYTVCQCVSLQCNCLFEHFYFYIYRANRLYPIFSATVIGHSQRFHICMHWVVTISEDKEDVCNWPDWDVIDRWLCVFCTAKTKSAGISWKSARAATSRNSFM